MPSFSEKNTITTRQTSSLVEIDNALPLPCASLFRWRTWQPRCPKILQVLSSKTRTCHTCHTFTTTVTTPSHFYCLLLPLLPLLNRLNYYFSSFSTLITFLAQILTPSITTSTSFHHLVLPLSALKQTRYMHHPSSPNTNFLALTCTRSQVQLAQKQTVFHDVRCSSHRLCIH